jgi:hypothetical protein
LDKAKDYSSERRTAIKSADAKMSEADIREFIRHCRNQPTPRVAPWLNCGTDAEKTELLRRCASDRRVAREVMEVYPEVAAYLSADCAYGEPSLDAYFAEYRELKVCGLATTEFCAKAQQSTPPSPIQNRDEMLQRLFADDSCALLVVDCMGAEWLPMLVALAKAKNIGVESVSVAIANLPTATKYNDVNWPHPERHLPKVMSLDNIVHHGAEKNENRPAEENLAAALDVLGNNVLPRVSDGLARFERVAVTADHGSSRLAVVAWEPKERHPQLLTCEKGAEIADCRYRERPQKGGGHQAELEETVDGKHWVVRGYDRLPKKGGYRGFEMHGGATLEERLVPMVILSRKEPLAPKPSPEGAKKQIVESEEFDI